MVQTLPADARPREKLWARGPAALADSELLALLLRTGTAGRGVLQMAEGLLDEHGGLQGLLQRTPQQLRQSHGLGPAKAAELAAVFEMARRASSAGLRSAPVFEEPAACKRHVQLLLAGLPYELFGMLWLDSQHRLIAWDPAFKGSLAQAHVYPREVVKSALAHNAGAVILCHNHPSGVAEPSRQDEQLTAVLKQALALVDVRVLDHLVVGHGSVVSMAERGLL